MDDSLPVIKDIEIIFPIDFLQHALNRCCVEGQKLYWEGKQTLKDRHERDEVRDYLNNRMEGLHIVTCRYDNFLTINIEKAGFMLAGKAILILDDIKEVDSEFPTKSRCLPVEITAQLQLVPREELESNNLNKNTQNNKQTSEDLSLELDPPENPANNVVEASKRKIKRKAPPVSYKKSKATKYNKTKTSPKESPISVKNNVSSCENSHVSSIRYSLRGRTIDPKIIKAEKGIYNEQDNESSVHSEKIVNNNVNNDSLKANEARTTTTEVKVTKEMSKLSDVTKERSEITDGDNNIANENAEPALKEWHKRPKLPKDKKCKYCDYSSRDYSYLLKHVQKHQQTDEVIEYMNELEKLKVANCTCSTCSIVFANESKLRSHEKREHNFAFCNLCCQMFKNAQSVKVHIRNIHERTEDQALICETCSATFKSIASLKQHQESVHLEKRNHPCSVCDKKFSTGSQLRRHIRIHGLDESKRIKCNLCSKSFLHRHNLQRHMQLVHSSDNKLEKYHCSYCGKGYTQKMNMISHVQHAHFNIFPYTCKLCKMTFHKSHFLLEHMMSVHKQTGVKISESSRNQIYGKEEDDCYYCAYCSQGFIHKIRLIEHMHFDHSTAFPFLCEHCNQGFLNKAFLILHSLKAHRIKIPEEGGLSANCVGTSDILRIISAKRGKLSTVDKAQDTEFDQTDNHVLCDHVAESSVSDAVTAGIDTESTVLVEVAEDTSSYQYVIESHGNLQDTDIARLLLAAQQSIHTRQDSKLPDERVETGEAREGIQLPETKVIPSLQGIQAVIDNESSEATTHYHILDAGQEINNAQTHDLTTIHTQDIQNSEIQASDIGNLDIEASDIRTSDIQNLQTTDAQNMHTRNIQTLEILTSDVKNIQTSDIQPSESQTSITETSDGPTENIKTLQINDIPFIIQTSANCIKRIAPSQQIGDRDVFDVIVETSSNDTKSVNDETEDKVEIVPETDEVEVMEKSDKVEIMVETDKEEVMAETDEVEIVPETDEAEIIAETHDIPADVNRNSIDILELAAIHTVAAQEEVQYDEN